MTKTLKILLIILGVVAIGVFIVLTFQGLGLMKVETEELEVRELVVDEIEDFAMGNNEEIRDFLIKIDNMSVNPDKFEVIREDFNKDGTKEIFTVISYCCPAGTILRILEKKENEQYDIKSEIHIAGSVDSVEVVSFPSGYKSIVLSSFSKGGTGVSGSSKGVYMFIDEKIIEAWQGLVQYSEYHIGAIDNSYNIENNYSIYFKDFDGDGEIDIIQKGEEKKEYINPETEERLKVEKNTVENIYKWNKEKRKYEKQ